MAVIETSSTGRGPDKLRLSSLETAGEKAVNGTIQFLTQNPNMGFFGPKDRSGNAWKVTPLFDDRGRTLKTVSIVLHGINGRIVSGWQVTVMETDQGTHYAVASIVQENRNRKKQRPTSRDFIQLVSELFSTRIETGNMDPSQPTSREIEPDLQGQ